MERGKGGFVMKKLKGSSKKKRRAIKQCIIEEFPPKPWKKRWMSEFKLIEKQVERCHRKKIDQKAKENRKERLEQEKKNLKQLKIELEQLNEKKHSTFVELKKMIKQKV